MTAVPAAAAERDLLDEIPQDLAAWEEAQLVAAASRLLAAVGELRAEAAANTAALAIESERLRRSYAALNAPLEGAEARYVEELRRVFAVLPLRGGKKSRKLPSGTLQMRTIPAKVTVIDPEALRVALRDLDPEMEAQVARPVTTIKLDHKALTGVMAAHDWTPLPGTEVVPEHEEFYARPDQAGAADPRD